MDLDIFVRGVEGGSNLREMAREKFDAALQRFTTHVRRATVRIEDETGPDQHRLDKVCAIELQLNNAGDVRIREVGDNFAATIDVAIDRMRAALGRQVSRAKRGVGEG